jgi:hypothetical protein
MVLVNHCVEFARERVNIPMAMSVILAMGKDTIIRLAIHVVELEKCILRIKPTNGPASADVVYKLIQNFK